MSGEAKTSSPAAEAGLRGSAFAAFCRLTFGCPTRSLAACSPSSNDGEGGPRTAPLLWPVPAAWPLLAVASMLAACGSGPIVAESRASDAAAAVDPPSPGVPAGAPLVWDEVATSKISPPAAGAAASALVRAAAAADDRRWAEVLEATALAPATSQRAWLAGLAHEGLGDDESARSAWSAVIAGTRWEIPAKEKLAALDCGAGRWLACAAAIEALPKPHSAGAALLLAKALAGPTPKGVVPTDALAAARDARARGSGAVTSEAEALLLQWGHTLDLDDHAARAETLNQRLDHDGAIALLSAHGELMRAQGHSRAAFELARAFHKRRRYSEAMPWFEVAIADRKQTDLVVRARYLHAQALARLARVPESVEAFRTLSKTHPEHSFADDALLHAAGLEIDDGRIAEGQGLLREALEGWPAGDMVEDVRWALAWSYLAPWARPLEETAALPPDPAIVGPLLDDAAAGTGPEGHEARVRGRYWRARLQEAVGGSADEGYRALASDEPLHWYGLLAAQRLKSIDGRSFDEVSSALAARRGAWRETEPQAFLAESSFLELPAVIEAGALIEAGLFNAASAELRFALGDRPERHWAPGTLLYAAHLAELSMAPAQQQDLARRALAGWERGEAGVPATLLTHAYPLAFHDAVRAATRDYAWDPLLLQGLVREESSFSPTVVSWAGAVGLSQLMPETARLTARKHGIQAAIPGDLHHPGTNLRIGAAYLHDLLGTWTARTPLAVASYNAGPGAVKRWIAAAPHAELDAFVEAIPFDQTRHYVVRVVGSWQAYRALSGSGEVFVEVDLGRVGVAAAPK